MEINLPKRKKTRHPIHDYASGDYFVTICTNNHIPYFGKINDGRLIKSAIGRFTDAVMSEFETCDGFTQILQYVIMPNHIHFIVRIKNTNDGKTHKLGNFIGRLKQRVKCYAKSNNIMFDWQRNYYDRIIRDYEEGSLISKYIESNIANWEADCYFGMH